ncbi:cytochrome P450 [Streptomyces sp. NPDC048252]|uniref:cytochrome P450 n=1 Tax=Streptomyces sp. NPDC048252 TaxID=3154612 RepID=UPI0034356083
MQPAHPTSPSSVAGFAVPVGANVLLSPYALHRDPDVFTDPKVFDPDRWRPERVTAAQRQAFIASGGGRRKCLGEFYGMPEAHLALAAISRRWQLRPAGARPARAVPRFLLTPQAGPMTLTRRPPEYAGAPAQGDR